MSGTKTGGRKAATTNKAQDKNFYVRIGAIGGRAGTGHEFGHGKIDPSETGKLGGRKSYTMPESTKRKISEAAKRRRQLKAGKAEAELFKPDDTKFSEGFNVPTRMHRMQKLMRRIHGINL